MKISDTSRHRLWFEFSRNRMQLIYFIMGKPFMWSREGIL